MKKIGYFFVSIVINLTILFFSPNQIYAQAPEIPCTTDSIDSFTITPQSIVAGQSFAINATSTTLNNVQLYIAIDFTPTVEGQATYLPPITAINLFNGTGTATVMLPTDFPNGGHTIAIVNGTRAGSTLCSIRQAITVTGGTNPAPPPSGGECKNIGDSCNDSSILCSPNSTFCELSIAFPIVKARGQPNTLCMVNNNTYTCSIGSPSSQTPDCRCMTEGAGPNFCYDNGVNRGLWTAIGCIPISDIVSLSTALLARGAALAGGISFLFVLAGAFQLITSRGDPEKLISGRQFITSAVSGLLLLVFCVFILKLVGIDILGVITK